MCVKNKNQYSCGCEYKEVNECGRHCEPEVGYRFVREYDCNNCKADGQQVPPLRLDQGRHVQDNRQRQKTEKLSKRSVPQDSTSARLPNLRIDDFEGLVSSLVAVLDDGRKTALNMLGKPAADDHCALTLDGSEMLDYLFLSLEMRSQQIQCLGAMIVGKFANQDIFKPKAGKALLQF